MIGVYHRDSVFFWLSTVVWSGILQGGFRREGWARTLARIEAGAGDDCVPKVHVLSRARLRRLFKHFLVESIRAAGVMPDDFLHLQVIARRIRRTTLERVFAPLGWYLVASVRKEPP